MEPNRKHPDYPEFKKKWQSICAEQKKETAKYLPSGGQDGPLSEIHKKYFSKLKALQKEYHHLYE